jgi:hypothetical protein
MMFSDVEQGFIYEGFQIRNGSPMAISSQIWRDLCVSVTNISIGAYPWSNLANHTQQWITQWN